jgi:DNA-binding NarL/FixJ family response regulator
MSLEALTAASGSESGVPDGRPATIRVLLVECDGLTRIGLRVLFGEQADFVVVGEAADGLSAVAVASRTRPDVVVLATGLPGIDALEAARRIAAQPHLDGTRVILLTPPEVDGHLLEALRLGVSGLVYKNAPPARLVEAVRVAAAGGAMFSPPVARAIVAQLTCRHHRKSPRDEPALQRLTDREREVVGLVGQGMTNSEIAEHLVITADTARTHVSRAMVKVGVGGRTQLAVFAFRSGLA